MFRVVGCTTFDAPTSESEAQQPYLWSSIYICYDRPYCVVASAYTVLSLISSTNFSLLTIMP
jgi:hypothetical protein